MFKRIFSELFFTQKLRFSLRDNFPTSLKISSIFLRARLSHFNVFNKLFPTDNPLCCLKRDQITLKIINYNKKSLRKVVVIVIVMSVEYFNAEQVRSVLNWPMVVAAVEEALKAFGRKDNDHPLSPSAVQPVRSMTVLDECRVLLTMPAFISQYRLPSSPASDCQETLACKLVTSFSANEQRSTPLANIQAHILLFNTATGQLKGILEATQITAWRTAAASIVATKYLYCNETIENHNFPLTVAIIGCGRQGQSHAVGVCATFNVSQIRLWNRTHSKAVKLAEELRNINNKHLEKGEEKENWVQICKTPQEALQGANIICIATFSPDALIDYNMLKESKVPIHINGKL